MLWLSKRDIWNFSLFYNSHSWVLCAELYFVSTTTLQGNTLWLSKSHLFEVLRYFSACYKHCYFAYLLSILTIILDRSDGLLTTVAKSIVSKKKLCDIWSVINLHGNKKNAALIFSVSQPEWKGLFSKPTTLDRIKIPWRTIKEYLSYSANFEFLSIISQQDIITV